MAKTETREGLQRTVLGARRSLGMVILFTCINMAMILTDTDLYFLVSISLPYYLTMMGKGLDNGFLEGAWDITGTFTVTGLVLSVGVLLIFAVCWWLSKKHTGALAAALVLFVVDSLALAIFTFALYESPSVNFIDFLFHIMILAEFGYALRAARKLKLLPEETPCQDESSLS